MKKIFNKITGNFESAFLFNVETGFFEENTGQNTGQEFFVPHLGEFRPLYI